MHDIIRQLEKKREMARLGGGQKRIDSQHKKGKLTARERIELLLDPESFEEWDMFKEHRCVDFGMNEAEKTPGDGVVIGYGTINGRLVFVFSQDFTVFGGSLSETHAEKICKVMDQAMKVGAPVIGLNDSGGARIQEGVASLGGYADVFQRNVMASGVVPQISMIMGPCAGGAVYSPSMTDFIFMVKDSSYMFVTGPEVVKTVTHEEVTAEELGGAITHSTKSGVCDRAFENDIEALLMLRRFINFLPPNNQEKPPFRPTPDPADRQDYSLDTLIPDNPNKPYDMKELILKVVDDVDFFEVQPENAKNIITGFARVDGWPVGIVANQPMVLAGCLDIKSSIKAARFRAFLRCLQYPGRDLRGCARLYARHAAGIRRHHQARRQTALRLRRMHRAQGYHHHPQGLRRRVRCNEFQAPAWRCQLRLADRRNRSDGSRRVRWKSSSAQDLERSRPRSPSAKPRNTRTSLPIRSWRAHRGFIDDVIMPHGTRKRIARSLAMLRDKKLENPWRKHGNIPL